MINLSWGIMNSILGGAQLVVYDNHEVQSRDMLAINNRWDFVHLLSETRGKVTANYQEIIELRNIKRIPNRVYVKHFQLASHELPSSTHTHTPKQYTIDKIFNPDVCISKWNESQTSKLVYSYQVSEYRAMASRHYPWSLVIHICVRSLARHWWKYWHVACLTRQICYRYHRIIFVRNSNNSNKITMRHHYKMPILSRVI